MFDTLAEKLGGVFDRLARRGALSEANVDEAMREIRVALLEADVALPVVKDFIAKVREQAVGQAVIKSVTPSQMVVKIVNDALVEMLGGENAALDLAAVPPVPVLMVGLQGSGKTTTSAKLALRLKKEKKKVLLASLDIYRPAAINQLQVVGERAGVKVFEMGQIDPRIIAKEALRFAKDHGNDVVILDTAGRLHIDTELMDELKDLKELTNPNEIMLVVDAMTGQDAVNVAKAFDDALGIDSVLMSKLDSDTRGGAALSVLAVTGKPIKYVGMGEKLDEFEQFHPQRMASRILGMGDMLTLIEKAENTISQKDAEKMAKKLEENRFDMDDLLEQLRQIQKMGSLKSIIGMLPGVGSKLKDADIDDRQFVRIEAMITSMTKAERAKPSIINPSRKRRIAAGSGTKVEDVNRLLKQFDQMQKMMKQLGGKAGKGGKMNRRAMKRLANMNPEQLQSLQGGIPGVPPGLMPPKK